MFKIEFLKDAYEEFKKLDKPIQERIKKKLDILAKNPNALKRNIKPLKGSYTDLYRLRIGNYRVIYKMEKEKLLILIVRVAHRREVY